MLVLLWRVFFLFLCRYIPLSSVLEGYVILEENPDYVEDHLA